jgi:hypothetical protein|tara:strand:+ start:404 stop:1948 length:1545 start_codon:yes stop_codon:yes gene_type:complete
MAIIYSYPLDTNPTTADLLLGTSIASGKPTKTFSIQSLVGLVNAQPTTGTVTNVATANSTFIDVQGGPITGAGTITASLSAGGTPSNTTFLRGDNTWAPASSTGSAQISVLDEGLQITSDVDSINFTGSGVTTTTAGNDVTVSIPSAAGGVTSIIGGTAINASSATGNITVTNTGITQLTAGTNITLSGTTGSVTINASNNPGTVQSVIPGSGLQLDSGTNISNPSIGIDKVGSNNYILVGSSAAVPTVNDYIAFNQISSSDVKTTTFATIPIAALPLVSTYIDSGDADVVKNNTDTFTSTAKIINVITLTSAEYASIGTPDVNTLYILETTGGTGILLTLATTNSIISPDGTGTGTGYTLSGNLTGSTFTGVEGEPYSFTTIVTPDAGYYFSIPQGGMVASGTVPAAPASIVQTLTGLVQVTPTPVVTATLLVVTNIQGGPASAYTISGSITGSTTVGVAPYNYGGTFTTVISDPPSDTNYTWSVGPTIVQASGTINGSQTVVTTITGTLQLT